MKIESAFSKILALIFLSILFFFLVAFIFSPKRQSSTVENRKLADLPRFKLAKLDPFPKQFDDYYSDHFAYKDFLINKLFIFNIKVLKSQSEFKNVIIGLDNFLFSDERDFQSGEKNLYSTAELQSIQKELHYRTEFCKSVGAKLYIVIIPSKQTYYPEYLALRYFNFYEKTKRKQLLNFLAKDSQIHYFDITDELLKYKNDSILLYYKTDTHWNSLGAFIGTQIIVNHIKKDFPTVKSNRLSDYTIEHKARLGGNIAQSINLASVFTDEDIVLKPRFTSHALTGAKFPHTPPKNFIYAWDFEYVTVNPKANSLKVLIVRDSYASFQKEFFQESFGKCVMIFDGWKHQMNETIVQAEKPDVVIIQVLESMLDNFLKNQSRPVQRAQ
jgi:hypothetical protein